MADLEDGNPMSLVINEVDDSVLTLSDPIAVDVPCQFFRALPPGIRTQRLNPFYDSLAIGFFTQRLDFLRG